MPSELQCLGFKSVEKFTCLVERRLGSRGLVAPAEMSSNKKTALFFRLNFPDIQVMASLFTVKT